MGIADGRVIAEGIVVMPGTLTMAPETDSDGEDPSSAEPNPFSSFSRSSSWPERGCCPSC